MRTINNLPFHSIVITSGFSSSDLTPFLLEPSQGVLLEILFRRPDSEIYHNLGITIVFCGVRSVDQSEASIMGRRSFVVWLLSPKTKLR